MSYKVKDQSPKRFFISSVRPLPPNFAAPPPKPPPPPPNLRLAGIIDAAGFAKGVAPNVFGGSGFFFGIISS